MNNQPPWEVQPALTLERLRVIADIIVKVRRDVAETTEVDEGDQFFGLWVAGTRVHARLSHHIKKAAENGLHPWLALVNKGMQFTFSIEGIPIRIYRGEPEKPSRGARKAGPLERAKQFEMFDLGLISKPDIEWRWRMAVETDPDGKVFNVTMLQMHSGAPEQVRNLYAIPLAAPATPVAPVIPFTPEAVEVPPAVVEALEHTAQEGGEGSNAPDGAGADGSMQVVTMPLSTDDTGN